MLSKMMAEKGIVTADTPGGHRAVGKAISAEDKTASGPGRDGHNSLGLEN